MCRVALIDDVEEQYEKYKVMLEKKGIELIFMEFIPDYPAIIEWLLDNQIEFVLVDYKLNTKYQFQGSQLIQQINNAIPDLQCVLFTSNTSDDDLVMDNLKVDKSIFYNDPEKYNKFIEMIKQAKRIFRNRQQNTLEDYNKLLKKEKLTALEEEQKANLYKRLVSYGLVEPIAEELMETKVEQKMDKLIQTIEKYIEDKE
ncbi:MAG: hypothetical protein HFJ43_04100 [Clostridia bacterium]|nr:hypothetical protein [Clostridia bacterium]